MQELLSGARKKIKAAKMKEPEVAWLAAIQPEKMPCERLEAISARGLVASRQASII